MCCKDEKKRRLHFLEKKEEKLAKKDKRLSDEEWRELQNLRNECKGKR